MKSHSAADVSLNALFVAADGGPRETLAPIARHCGLAVAAVTSDHAHEPTYWAREIERTSAALLVTGTSDSARGRRIESAARRAARSAGIPIASIEDFPGNHYEVIGGEASLVIVESASAREFCAWKCGLESVEVFVPARYDDYRLRIAQLREDTRARWQAARGRTVLWAGQPETECCLRTLAAVLPLIKSAGAELLFKAHPRDEGYPARYDELLATAGLHATDVTALSVAQALGRGPHLVVTQFSSLAIEAGFFGIPSLWVLLSDAGGESLEEKKGYHTPALCLAHGAAAAFSEQQLAHAFTRTLENGEHRLNLIRCFDDYFRVHERGAAAVVQRLRGLVAHAK